jgi:hypothetical protein
MFLKESHHPKQNHASYSNVLEVNPSHSELFYISKNICTHTRTISINEYQDSLCSVNIGSSFGRELFSTYISSSNSFGNKISIDFDSLFLGLIGPKMIVIYDIFDVSFIDKICSAYKPDLILYSKCKLVGCLEYINKLSIDNNVGYRMPERFAGLDLSFYSNNIGIDILNKSLERFDGLYRMNSKCIELVTNFTDIAAKDGFYENEYDGNYSWSWSGPTNSGCFYIPTTRISKNKITLYFLDTKVYLTSTDVNILIDGNPVHVKYFPEENKIEIYPDYCRNQIYYLVEIRYRQGKIVDDHSRRIGLAIHKVKIEDIL